MIVGTFAPYTTDQQKASEQDLDLEPTSAAVFNLLTLPLFVHLDERGPRIGSDKDRPRKLKKIKRAFRPLILQELGADRTSRRLMYEGGEVVMEDDEAKILRAVWDEFRSTLPDSMCDGVVAVEDWFEGLSSWTVQEWQAEQKRRAEGAAPVADKSPTEPVGT